MLESCSALGSFVQTPCGPRKSGIPESVEMPARVRTTIREHSSIHRHADVTAASADRSASRDTFIDEEGYLRARASQGRRCLLSPRHRLEVTDANTRRGRA